MDLDDYRTSSNVRDLGSGGGGGGFGGGGGLGLILGLVGSRFGIVGVIVVVVGAMLLGMNPFGGGTQSVTSSGQGTGASAAQVCSSEANRFSCQVLASTEDTWTQIFSERGQRYQPAGFSFYSRGAQSGCGAAQSAMGPFYCPTDNNIYLDTSFYDELQNRFGAAGDFAQAYVIAHEVGHHIQQLTGTLDAASQLQARGSRTDSNATQVRVELQADCYAGVWAARNRDRLEPGDIEEGLRAAQAIGDDTLQKAGQGYVVPESFTHGTSAQRQAWLQRGLQSGDPAVCDTFTGAV